MSRIFNDLYCRTESLPPSSIQWYTYRTVKGLYSIVSTLGFYDVQSLSMNGIKTVIQFANQKDALIAIQSFDLALETDQMDKNEENKCIALLATLYSRIISEHNRTAPYRIAKRIADSSTDGVCPPLLISTRNADGSWDQTEISITTEVSK